MTVGLILLALSALLIFFGLADRLFKTLKIANWIGFILILALSIGAIAPVLKIGDHFEMSIGGFLLPVLFMFAIGVVVFRRRLFLRAFAAQMLVMAVTVLMLFVFPVAAPWQIVLNSVLTGLICGVIAYAAGGYREAVLYAVFGGLTLGELLMRLFDFFLISGQSVRLGSGMIFDAIIVAALAGVVFAEVAARVRLFNAERQVGKNALNFEAGTDWNLGKKEPKQDDFSDYFDDTI